MFTPSDITQTESEAELGAASTALASLKTRIDEMRLQAELAQFDVGDIVRTQLGVAENSYLAAESRLRQIGPDVARGFDSARSTVEALLKDVRAALDATEAVIRRG